MPVDLHVRANKIQLQVLSGTKVGWGWKANSERDTSGQCLPRSLELQAHAYIRTDKPQILFWYAQKIFTVRGNENYLDKSQNNNLTSLCVHKHSSESHKS